MAYEILGMAIEEENALGRFSFAEPNYGGTLTVFRSIENGHGPVSLAAELVSREQGVIRSTVFCFLRNGRRTPVNRMQAENALRKELDLL
ncbi:MAG: hypothetical protein PHX93_03240 [Candidatus Peribacteraceae bacterium]|nr:hypothetical protein [Candidatus Peribacteraceae bacterium]